MNSLNRALETIPITKNHFRLPVLLILIQLFLIYAFIQGYIGKVLIVGFGLGLLFFTAFSVTRTFYLLVFYFLALPEKFYSYNFPGLPIYFVWYVGYPLFIMLLSYWLISLLRNQGRNEFNLGKFTSEKKSTSPTSLRTMDLLLIIFIIFFSLSGILGYLRGFNRMYCAYDFVGPSLYLGYFVYLNSVLREKPKLLNDFALFCAVLVGFEFIYALIRFGGFLVLRRIVSTHIHIAQMAIPYIGTTIIYSTSRFRKIFFAALLPIVIIGVIISQQRALWGSVGLTLILLLMILAYEKRHSLFKSLTRTIYWIVLIVIALGGLFILLQVLTKGKFLSTIIYRALIFLSPKMLSLDISAIVRTSEIKNALGTVGNDFLFGRGLGDAFISRWRGTEQHTVDNSFAFLYWKTGFLGLFSFIALILYFLYRSISVLKKKLLKAERIYALTALLNMTGLLVVAFTNVCIVQYHMIIAWAATFAVVELIARKYETK
jgi:hypothetical protein